MFNLHLMYRNTISMNNSLEIDNIIYSFIFLLTCLAVSYTEFQVIFVVEK